MSASRGCHANWRPSPLYRQEMSIPSIWHHSLSKSPTHQYPLQVRNIVAGPVVQFSLIPLYLFKGWPWDLKEKYEQHNTFRIVTWVDRHLHHPTSGNLFKYADFHLIESYYASPSQWHQGDIASGRLSYIPLYDFFFLNLVVYLWTSVIKDWQFPVPNILWFVAFNPDNPI